ncbi:porin [Paraburkholderia gardini]|uniref:porin n=1 Tax=Paraburkholderia gardini TaxID=2823469 RepID=UPI001DB02895|nr:porin [Paraburkholderia gardini]CAG4925060.1 Outer membrane porin protein 32 [Paraburkholderia gardini]
MKKQFAAGFALAAIAGAVHAQSSVTLYGTVDAGLMTQTSSAASYSTAARNAGSIVRYKDGGVYTSLWGMRGADDLGGGYKATFQLQGSFDTGSGKSGLGDTGAASSSIFNMAANVGLSGALGSIKMGRQYAPMILALADTDARHAEYFGSVLTALLGLNSAAGWVGASTNGSIGAVYDSNAIVYTSPAIAGFSASLEYAPGGVAGSIQGNTRESAVLQYNGYGLKAAAIYYNGHDTNPGAATVLSGLDNNRFMSLSALYTRSGFSISGSYSNGRNPSNSGAADFNMITGGLAYAFTPALMVSSGVYYIKDRNHSANQSTAFSLSTEYSLSKSTLVYADAGYVDNRGVMNQALEYGQPVAPGVGTSAFMVGLRHKF